MTIYHSSDWHIGHTNIIRYCERPFDSVDEMNHAILTNANAVVGPADKLILHGDNVMGSYEENLELLRQLRAGELIILPGNHDRYSIAYNTSFGKRETAAVHVMETLTTPERKVQVLPDRKPSAWRSRIAGRDVALSHYPYSGDSHGKDRHVDMRPRDLGLPLIHGHVHAKWRENGRMLNVGVDVWDFKPVSQDAIGVWMDTLSGDLASTSTS